MLPKPLLDILEPAYRPCAHFDGACAGACVWEPARGMVPCAFGGALGSLEEVCLIIVTAEPGDPPDSTGYQGTPQDLVQNSVRIFREGMQNGGIERADRARLQARGPQREARVLDASGGRGAGCLRGRNGRNDRGTAVSDTPSPTGTSREHLVSPVSHGCCTEESGAFVRVWNLWGMCCGALQRKKCPVGRSVLA